MSITNDEATWERASSDQGELTEATKHRWEGSQIPDLWKDLATLSPRNEKLADLLNGGTTLPSLVIDGRDDSAKKELSRLSDKSLTAGKLSQTEEGQKTLERLEKMLDSGKDRDFAKAILNSKVALDHSQVESAMKLYQDGHYSKAVKAITDNLTGGRWPSGTADFLADLSGSKGQERQTQAKKFLEFLNDPKQDLGKTLLNWSGHSFSREQRSELIDLYNNPKFKTAMTELVKAGEYERRGMMDHLTSKQCRPESGEWLSKLNHPDPAIRARVKEVIKKREFEPGEEYEWSIRPLDSRPAK